MILQLSREEFQGIFADIPHLALRRDGYREPPGKDMLDEFLDIHGAFSSNFNKATGFWEVEHVSLDASNSRSNKRMLEDAKQFYSMIRNIKHFTPGEDLENEYEEANLESSLWLPKIWYENAYNLAKHNTMKADSAAYKILAELLTDYFSTNAHECLIPLSNGSWENRLVKKLISEITSDQIFDRDIEYLRADLQLGARAACNAHPTINSAYGPPNRDQALSKYPTAKIYQTIRILQKLRFDRGTQILVDDRKRRELRQVILAHGSSEEARHPKIAKLFFSYP
jgi:hypothetical protein